MTRWETERLQMADEFSVAVQSVLDTFESSPDTFLEVAVVDSLRLATANLEPSNQGERDMRWAESAAMKFLQTS